MHRHIIIYIIIANYTTTRARLELHTCTPRDTYVELLVSLEVVETVELLLSLGAKLVVQ
jgi:hypothetical protein